MANEGTAIPVVTDIHGNREGLELVLAALVAQGLEGPLLVLGDLVWHGYADYDPSGVLDLLLATPLFGVVAGNTDRWLFDGWLERWQPTDVENVAEKEAMLALKAHLAPRHREFLRGLPDSLTFDLAGRRVVATHAAPASNHHGLLPDLPADEMARLLGGLAADVLVTGHLHRPFLQLIGGLLHVGVGAVGKHPPEFDGQVEYAVLTERHGRLAVRYFSCTQSRPRSLVSTSSS